MFPYDYGSEAPETLGTVYVVDDDDAVRDSLKWLLEASDYRVELYDSGESFIAKYDPKAIAVLVLDVRMPGMSGLEVQEHLLARKAELPIIFITGHGDVSMAVNALKRGAVDFIEKPFEQAALKQLVERMLREARERHMEKERRSLNEALLAKLTPREQQVLERIIHGRLNKQIADDLGISIKTVEYDIKPETGNYTAPAGGLPAIKASPPQRRGRPFCFLNSTEHCQLWTGGFLMTAKIIDGKALAARIQDELKTRVEACTEHGHRPGLAVVLVGEDPASQVYVRNKVRACERTGIRSDEIRMPAETTEAELLAVIDRLNHDDAVDGILVQLPLPKHLSSELVIAAISPEKDVDGFHVVSAGSLLTGRTGFRPCTPYGVMKLLEEAGCDPAGKHAVVIGRSNIVGKPQALMLLEKNASVTIVHSRTTDLAEHTRRADILVAAVGRAKMVKADMVKPGAVVIDVGMNRDENGKLCGDVDYENVREVASAITPVPGGVGPMTIAMLMTNTVEAVERRLGL